MGNHVETLRWNGTAIDMIDQRMLPHRIEYVACDSARSVADAIHDMVVRGAPAIGVAAAYGIALEAIRQKDETRSVFSARLNEGFATLAASRPTAVNLFWALNRMKKLWESHHGKSMHALADIFLQTAHLSLRNPDAFRHLHLGFSFKKPKVDYVFFPLSEPFHRFFQGQVHDPFIFFILAVTDLIHDI